MASKEQMATPPSPKRQRLSSPIRAASEKQFDISLGEVPARPSFLSPTRASLSRSNPALLPKSRSPVSTEMGVLPRNRQKQSLGFQAREYVLHGRRSDAAQTLGAGDKSDMSAAREDSPSSSEEDSESASPKAGRPSGEEDGSAEAIESTRVDYDDDSDLALPTPERLNKQFKDTPPRGILYTSSGQKRPRSESLIKTLTKDSSKGPELIEKLTVDYGSADGDLVGNSEAVGTAAGEHPLQVEVKRRESKKREIARDVDELEDEIRRLERQMELNERPTGDEALSEANVNDLVNILMSHANGGGHVENEEPKISDVFSAFLPFASELQDESYDEDYDPDLIASHRPIDAENPIHNMRSCTPLTVTSTVSLPLPPCGNTHQLHSIRLASPDDVLIVKLAVVIDALDQSIVSITLTDITYWAETELGCWIRKKVMVWGDKDINSIAWACATYWNAVVSRARCWMQCSRAYGLLMAKISGGAPPMMDMVTIDTELTRDEIVQNGCLQTFSFGQSDARVTPRWFLWFDRTGRAESRVDLHTIMPKGWSVNRFGLPFAKVPTMFDTLVQQHGVYQSVVVVLRLIFANGTM